MSDDILNQLPKLLTIGEAAQLFGISHWKVSRVYEEGDVDSIYAGRNRIVLRDDLPKVKEALKKRGYLKRPKFAGILAS